MAESRLAEIYRKELKTKGLLGALVSASGARMKEKTDIRNILPQTGISGAAFEKMFGKKYRYGGNKDSVRSSGGDSGGGEVSKSMEEKLTRIGVDSKLTAKNTIVLPAMARDMNLMRMNMQKMVKLSGGTPSNKSDMFFKRASDRETQYESQFKKNSLSPTSTNAEAEKSNSFGVLGFLGNLVKGLFGGILHGLTSLFSTLLGPLLTNMVSLLIKGGLILGIMALIGKYVLDDKFRESVNKIVVDLWSKVPEEFKKQLLVGGAILLGAIAVWKTAMFLLGIAIDKLRLKLLGINLSGCASACADGPGGRGRGGRGRGGRRGRPGAGNRMKNLGRFGLYGMGAYGLYEGYNYIFGGNEEESEEEYEDDWVPEPGQFGRGENETEAEFKKRFPQNYPEVEESSSNQSRLGLNVDTALAVGGTALGAGGLVYSANKIKKTLTPKTPTSPTPASGTKPGFLMTAEDKIRERGAAQAKASSKWGRFLAFVAKKSPGLYARLGVKLAAMAGMATIPIAGWVSALFTLAFAISDIYAIYSLWSEFTNTDEETANPDVNEAKSKATNVTSAKPVQQDVGFVDAEGVYHTGPAPQPASRLDTPMQTPNVSNTPQKVAYTPTPRSSYYKTLKTGVAESGDAIEAIGFFTSKGWSGQQAAGIVANLQAESNFKTNAVGDGGKAYGIAQWHSDRQALFEKQYGKPIQQSNFREQLEFVNWELNNSEKRAGNLLRQATSADQAAALVDQYYERSSGIHRQKRIDIANNLSGKASVIASTPNTGNALTQAHNNLSSSMLAMNGGGGQIINNNTTNAVMGGGSKDSDRSVNPYNADLMKYILSQVT